MPKANPNPRAIIIFLLFIISLPHILTYSAFAQMNQDKRRAQSALTRPFSRTEVRLVIRGLQAKGEDWSATEIDYVLNNINRNELLTTVRSWESRKETVLTRRAKINLLIDYLLTERAGLKALPSYLDEIGTEDDRIGITDRWKIEVAATNTIQNEYGRLKLLTIPEKSEVYIDEEFVNYSENEFVLLVGSHSVRVRNEGFYEFSTHVEIEKRKTRVLKCELVKK